MKADTPSPDRLDDASLQWLESLDPAELTDELRAAWRGVLGEFAGGRALPFRAPRAARPAVAAAAPQSGDVLEAAVRSLVLSYRHSGHLCARLDPLGLAPARRPEELEPASHGLTDQPPETRIHLQDYGCGEELTFAELTASLEQTYCGTIGVEADLQSSDRQTVARRDWLFNRLERRRHWFRPTPEDRRRLLRRLVAASGLERHLARNYPGAKRFGLEGGESLIPLLDTLIDTAAGQGARELCIGMAHRGRLNVLVNVFGKPPEELFAEFEGKAVQQASGGDVKYHQGFSSRMALDDGRVVHLSLSFNPSHLEVVAPVVIGSVRARQERRGAGGVREVAPILLHGDAAFSGQGVVMETLQMSGTRGYGTGGAVHVVVNNQVGYTTSDPRDARSTRYCTDVARIVSAPVLHINADDPEAVCFAAALAMEYRYTFNSDIVLDLVCYRRLGHNEADEPSITQPVMYSAIREHLPVHRLYASRLQQQGELADGGLEQMQADYQQQLDSGGQTSARPVARTRPDEIFDWTPYLGADDMEKIATGISRDRLKRLGEALCDIPESFVLQPQVERLMRKRRASYLDGEPMDWGCAELLAYASLLEEGYPIRFTGQDSRRGTFSHRHLYLADQHSGKEHLPIARLARAEGGGALSFYDSLLSEEAVLAFEYGYAATWPEGLTVWEAQFGDFANGAQIVIDQFVVSGEEKWNRLSGLVLLLPHGYEGQGPEHSSARLERFLQQCAGGNIQVCVPSSPAQMFHLLRRQVLRRLRRPLVVMTPKNLLRHPQAVSTHRDIVAGEFSLLIDDAAAKPDKVRRVVTCSGRIYYRLAARRDELAARDVALVRIEQLYPFPYSELVSLLDRYPAADTLIWCQEEPSNQGAWHQIMHRFYRSLNQMSRQITLVPIARQSASSPASGWIEAHRQQEELLLQQVFEQSAAAQDAADQDAAAQDAADLPQRTAEAKPAETRQAAVPESGRRRQLQ